MRMLRLLALLALACPCAVRAQSAPAATAPASPPAAAAAAPAAPAAPPEAFPQPQQAPAAEVQPAQPATPPPPPPTYGYGYAPPPDPNRVRALSELQNLDLRIASVRREQKAHSIIGPAIMTGAGYGVAAALGVAAIIEWAIADDIRDDNCGTYRGYRDSNRCDVNDDGVIDSDDRRAARTLARTFGILSGVGAGVGIAGTVLLVSRLAKRKLFNPELRDLGIRRGQLLQQLRYGGSYSQNGVMLSLRGNF